MSKREYENKIIDKINQEQLEHRNNNLDMYKTLDDKTSDFTYGLDKVADGDRLYHDASPTPFVECSRFCIDHTDKLDEGAIRRNIKMKLNKKTHSPADGE